MGEKLYWAGIKLLFILAGLQVAMVLTVLAVFAVVCWLMVRRLQARHGW